MHNKAYMYAKEYIKSKKAPKYVKKQAKQFIYIADGKSDKYFINEERLKRIESILKLLIMPKGLKAGQTLYECTCNYQWLFYTSLRKNTLLYGFFFTRIIIHRPSRWFFICGHSPDSKAAPYSANMVCVLCYFLRPVN